MMGLKYLHEEDYARRELWRNTIQLFHQTERPNFVGPFKAAGIDKYIIEARVLLSGAGEEKKADILASGKSGWLVLELSLDTKSKKNQLESYRNIDPRSLGSHGLPIHKTPPDVMVSRYNGFIPDGPYCKILVKDALKVKGVKYISNTILKEELQKASGIDLRKLPEVAFTLVPEMKSQEIRRGLIDLVMKIFDPECDGMTPVDLAYSGLERLSDVVSEGEKSILIKKVSKEMKVLIDEYLSEYLAIDETSSKYKATDKFKEHHSTRAYVVLKLREWAGVGPQTTLNDF
jgi:hypothetical protein